MHACVRAVCIYAWRDWWCVCVCACVHEANGVSLVTTPIARLAAWLLRFNAVSLDARANEVQT